MKSLLIIVAFICIAPASLFCQNTANEFEPISFVEVVDVTKSKKEIYLATRLWFYKNFNSYEGVVSVDDFENGIMYAKGILPTNYFKKGENIWKSTGVGGHVNFNLRVYFQDNRYKVIFDDLIHENISITSGTTINAGFGLITNNPEAAEAALKMIQKSQDRAWNLLQEKAPIQIKELLESLKVTVANENEMNFKAN
jgi:hypothetical protein